MLDISEEVAIVGIGQSEFSARAGGSAKTMILTAVQRALLDAGLAGKDVDGFVTEASLMPDVYPVEELAQRLGTDRDFFAAHSGIVGAGIVLAPRLAAAALKAGMATTVVSYFGVDWGSQSGAYGWHGQLPQKASLEMPFGFFGQPVYFAQLAQRYMHDYGVGPEAFGAAAVSARAWAQLNPSAQERRPLSLDDYFASPLIADPVRRADCCLLTDGAAAFVMTTPERARDLRQPPVSVAACETSYPKRSVHSFLTQQDNLLLTEARTTAPRALSAAGITTKDVDFVNLYDCFTVSVLMQLEDLGFCEAGEAGHLFTSGATLPGGSLPVNSHGGMLAEAYLMGINNINEAVRQLRNQAGPRQIPHARAGVVSGYSAQHTTLVLAAS
jgi:acetyl-CoA acetyltransferase